jgi:hypothetical protein
MRKAGPTQLTKSTPILPYRLLRKSEMLSPDSSIHISPSCDMTHMVKPAGGQKQNRQSEIRLSGSYASLIMQF